MTDGSMSRASVGVRVDFYVNTTSSGIASSISKSLRYVH